MWINLSIYVERRGYMVRGEVYGKYTSPQQRYMENIPLLSRGICKIYPLLSKIESWAENILSVKASKKITDLHGWLLVFHLRYKYHILTQLSWILHICKNVGRPTRSSVNILRLLPPHNPLPPASRYSPCFLLVVPHSQYTISPVGQGLQGRGIFLHILVLHDIRMNICTRIPA